MFEVPASAWDVHCHIFQPHEFAYTADSPYAPPSHTATDLLRQSLCENHVIVMSVPEGTDYRNLLDAMKDIRRRGRGTRGVAVLSDIDLQTSGVMHALEQEGVRGVRIHEARLRLDLGRADLSFGDISERFARSSKQIHLAGVQWSIEAQLDLTYWAQLVPIMRQLYRNYGTMFVVDHTFNMQPSDSVSTHFDTVLQGVSEGFLWVKISGLSRCATDIMQMRPILERLFTTRSDRLLYGSDAPHVVTTQSASGFAQVDLAQHLHLIRDICRNRPEWWDSFLRDNAMTLYR